MSIHRRVFAPRTLLLLLCTGVLLASDLQGRELHWSELTVRANLDAEGRLWVEERHAMVFTGDWNGGERRFDLGLGQRLELQSLSRLDLSTETFVELQKGDLDEVDHYGWVENRTLRWRSRLPSDPPFENEEITYAIEYSLSGILRPEGSTFRIHHDFAFPDRYGTIECFRLDLTLDPIWRATSALEKQTDCGPLLPGQSFVRSADLEYLGEGRPDAALFPLSPWASLPVFLASLVAMLVLARRFFRREKASGRFDRTSIPSPPSREWLDAHCFSWLPEEVGAIWDQKIAAPEVAAVIARLVGEGKLESRVEKEGFLFKRPVLHLRLRVARGEFSASYERLLINKLFFDGREETSTREIRKRYRKSGFSPVGLIKPSIERRLKQKLIGTPPPKEPIRWLILALALWVLCLVLEGATRGSDQFLVLFGLSVLSLPFLLMAGFSTAARYHRRAQGLKVMAGWMILIPLLHWGLHAAAVLSELLFGHAFFAALGPFGMVALALTPVLHLWGVLRVASNKLSPQAVTTRRLLATVRDYFADELDNETPQLDDAWLPYLVAFGLDKQVDKWFKSFGGSTASRSTSSSFGSSSSSFGSSGSSWTGGGGSFGGAGASAAWAGAATSMAAGVSSASSGSSGGGGGSSGGGGGGGW